MNDRPPFLESGVMLVTPAYFINLALNSTIAAFRVTAELEENDESNQDLKQRKKPPSISGERL